MIVDSFQSAINHNYTVEIHSSRPDRFSAIAINAEADIEKCYSFRSLEAAYAFCMGRGWLGNMSRFRKHCNMVFDGMAEVETPEGNAFRPIETRDATTEATEPSEDPVSTDLEAEIESNGEEV